ncbi:MAG: polyprenyl synthetase family protein [Aquabacterium sp.]
MNNQNFPAAAVPSMIQALGFDDEMARLRRAIADWSGSADPEMRAFLAWQFEAGSKYFRPLTLFACHRAVAGTPITRGLIHAALAVEMFHNMTLIVDDILDKSPQRRGKPTLHTQFGELQALMCSGWIVADGYDIVTDPRAYEPGEFDPQVVRLNVRLLSELVKRLGAAEVMQWRLRRQPLGVEDWRRIAGEDTGSMFEVCACLGTRSERLRRYGALLGMLYHGCDDVGDVRGAVALGGGGVEDLRDGILTLPAALAIRDPAVRALFCKAQPSDDELKVLAQANAAQLDEAERLLDDIAQQAVDQARQHAADPQTLIALVEHTRRLSR